jgi:beta-glucosidase
MLLQCILYVSFSMRVQSLYQREPFLWGVATAAYQIEGATFEDGRGPSIWDTFSLIPGKIHNSDNGSIADDSYHKILTDIQLIKNMGLNSYRFSLSWSRIFPSGYGEPNQAGIDHYQFLIDQLISADIEPLVTLYHWDLPQGLEDKYKGWLSTDIEVDFSNYADLCFAQFGDRVKKWTTLNEPWTAALQGYVTGNFAPGRCSNRANCAEGNSSTEGYLAAHNMLNAHAAVVALYREKYQTSQRGIIGITLNLDFAAPLRADTQSDVTAAQRRNEFALGWFSDPIVFGHYPQSMLDLVGDRLPAFSDQQRERLTHSYDFIGLNHYSTKYYFDSRDRGAIAHMTASCPQSVSDALLNTTDGTYTIPHSPIKWGGWNDDQLTVESKYDSSCVLIGEQADSPWLNVVPWGFYRVIMWLHDRYAVEEVVVIGDNITSRFTGPLIYITENGCDAPGESAMSVQEALNDTFRCTIQPR